MVVDLAVQAIQVAQVVQAAAVTAVLMQVLGRLVLQTEVVAAVELGKMQEIL